MKVMCFTEEEIADVLQVIAGVLQLGNVNFMAAGGAQVAEKSGMSETETDFFTHLCSFCSMLFEGRMEGFAWIGTRQEWCTCGHA